MPVLRGKPLQGERVAAHAAQGRIEIGRPRPDPRRPRAPVRPAAGRLPHCSSRAARPPPRWQARASSWPASGGWNGSCVDLRCRSIQTAMRELRITHRSNKRIHAHGMSSCNMRATFQPSSRRLCKLGALFSLAIGKCAPHQVIFSQVAPIELPAFDACQRPGLLVLTISNMPVCWVGPRCSRELSFRRLIVSTTSPVRNAMAAGHNMSQIRRSERFCRALPSCAGGKLSISAPMHGWQSRRHAREFRRDPAQ